MPGFWDVINADPLGVLLTYWNNGKAAVGTPNWSNAQLYFSAFLGRMHYMVMVGAITQGQFDAVAGDIPPRDDPLCEPCVLVILDDVEYAIFYGNLP
jgi:hypothetical protein